MLVSRSFRQRIAVRFVATLFAVLSLLVHSASGQEESDTAFGKLKYLRSVKSPELASANSITTDQSGKFVYVTSWNANTVNVFSRDAADGALARLQAVNSQRDLNGVTSVRLSRDGSYAVSAAFRAKAASLFRREPDAGTLELLDVARYGEKGIQGMEWAIDATFSLDNQFVFVVDPRGPGLASPTTAKNNGALVVLEVTKNDRLRWVETNIGENDCFAGVRGIMMLPDGKTLIATCSNNGNVVLVDWDNGAKKTSIRQVITDGESEATSLAGAMKCVCSSDGSTLYISSGRFQGDSAVSVFKIDERGLANFVQQIYSNQMNNFIGGNDLCISPDDKNLYVAATRSSGLACFERDLGTGELSYIETLADDATGFLRGAAAVCVSPDGKHAYVAAEMGNSIAIFERDTSK